MPIRRFILSKPPSDSSARLEGSEAHHLIHVLRGEVGGGVELIDGTGCLWSGRIARILGDQVELADVVLVSEAPVPEVTLTLVQALCKADRLAWILQKATELEISEIYLVQSRRSVVKISERHREAKLVRWRAILANAAKQSRQTTLPILHPPRGCRQVCGMLTSDLKLFVHPGPEAKPLKALLGRERWRSVAFAIGPEGGWTDEESRIFLENGFRTARLGNSILRTETAAIVTAALLRHELCP